MENSEHSDFTVEAFKVGTMWLLSFIAHNYHVVAGNILVTLSIIYLIWKWRHEFLKSKKEAKK
jgi:hypothetical protein